MGMRESYTQGTFILRVIIAIPAFAGPAASLDSLISAGTLATGTLPGGLLGFTLTNADWRARIIGCKVHKYAPGNGSGVQRGAMLVANSTTDTAAAEYVAAGEDYYEPSNRDIAVSFPRDASGAGFNALAVLAVMGSAGA